MVDVHIIHSNISPIVGKISYDFSLILPSILKGPEPYTNKLDNPYAANIKHIILFISFNVVFVIYFFIIVIIFFTTSILFNSLKQPLAVIFVIPISYIGVFLTFYLFRLNFDQGGFASFVLLCGITVNASIYILNEYNQLRRRFPMLTPLRAYLKAWNAKITPILLTILSTILGFVPFLLGVDKEAFWFPLAAGTIGGLILSLLGIFVYLPLFALRGTGEDSFIPRSLQTH